MSDDRRIVISSEPTLTVDEIARRTFGTSFRGFDPSEVRTYLRRVSEELGAAQQREKELRRQLEEAERTVVTPPVPDEETFTRILGQETARVLQSAREAAAEITARAEQKVGRLLREAQDEAARLRTDAEGVLARRIDEAEQVAAGIRRAAEEEAAALRARVASEAEEELDAARERGREMVAEAQTARQRLLTDLTRRRRLAEAQIEQLRAGRERLLDAYRVVRRTLDEVTEELTVAEAEARQAASAAARRVATEPHSSEATEADAEAQSGAATPVTAAHEAPSVAARLQPSPPEGASPAAAPSPAGPDAPAPAGPAAPARAGPDAPAPVAPRPSASPAPRHDAPAASDDAPTASPDAPARRHRAVSPTSSAAVRPASPAPAPARPGAAPAGSPEAPAISASPGREPQDPLAPIEAPGAPVAEVAVPSAGPVAAAPDEGSVRVLASSGQAASAPSVDDLFARIRAARAEAVTRANDVLASVPAREPEAEDGSGAAAPAEVTVADDVESALQRRDGVLEPLEATLTRKLKRMLQDEQNATLDALRTVRGRPAVDTILPPVAEQAQRYCSVALPLLEQAHSAGAAFAGGSPTEGPTVAALAEDLASELVGPLRDLVGRCLREAAEADDDEGGIVERVSGTYREWKAQRIERLARDHVAAAFGQGSFAAAAEGVRLRWLVDDEDGPCPDCDDNALAGPLPKGEPFPTGVSHPPAHAGCRCLLVAAPA